MNLGIADRLGSSGAAADAPTIFCLHYLGGSGREYASVAQLAGTSLRFRPIDLAGFGDSHRATGFSVEEMARAVIDTVRVANPPRWWLMGHSMGAKVAAVITAQIEHGSVSLAGLESLVLIAGSPPAPEPMDDDKRRTMLGWFHGGQSTSAAERQHYIEQNVSTPLTPGPQAQALDDLQRMNRAAWAAWLNSGSREDWSHRVGVLKTPALLIAGSDDNSLGVAAQQKFVVPHFSNSSLHVMPGATHLLPLEAPAELARLSNEHARSLRG